MRLLIQRGGAPLAGLRFAAFVVVLIGWPAGCDRESEHATSQPITEIVGSAAELADQLLGCDDATRRRELVSAIARLGAAALEALASAIGAPDADVAPSRQMNLLAAMQLFKASGDQQWDPMVRRLQRRFGFDEEQWRVRLQRSLLLDRLAGFAHGDGAEAIGVLRERARVEALSRHRAFSLADGHEELARLAQRYWDSWGWLGQQRGEAFAGAYYSLAEPERDAHVSLRTETAGRKLEAAAALTAVDTAAAIVQSLRAGVVGFDPSSDRIVARIVRDLPRADARRRQRAAWVLGRAWEVEFCDHAERAGPAWLTPEDIEQVKRHAASLGIKCEPLREASGRYSRPVDLPRRLVTRARQLEHELTVALRAGDAGVAEVVERWTDSELGWTDRLAEVLREPSEPGEAGEVALAMTLACEYNVQGVRSELAVRQGASGPDWIRQLARLASASLETQAGDRVTAWPDEMERLVVGLEGEAAAVVRMLAAGGPAMIDAFERATGAGSNATFALIEAARAEARRRRQP